MSRNAAAETSLRGRLEAMFVAAGDDPADVEEVVVADRQSAADFLESCDAEWFAFFMTRDGSGRFGRVMRRYVFAVGSSPDDAAAELINMLRHRVAGAVELARGMGEHAADDVASFERAIALFEDKR